MDLQKLIDRLIQMILTLLVSLGLINAPSNMPVAQTPSISPSVMATLTASPTPSPAPTPTPTTPTASPTLDPQSLRPEPGSVCAYDPQVESLLGGLEQASWVSWIELLSGEKPVTINGETYTILTRYTESMFNGNPNARAYEFVFEQLREWGYQDGIDLLKLEYSPKMREPKENWKNIVVHIPGKDPELAHEQVLLTAHLDSISVGNPEERAPGADDNGSGVATLLEAARIFKNLDFRRTVKIVFFSGEELGLNGSRAYFSQYAHELQDIVGVFNLDMFGYDADNDHCFEIHVGWTPASNLIGGCLADTVEAYDLGLNFEYIVKDAITASDHATFWNEGVGAIEILENFRTDEFENGCGERDVNPHYHTENDLIAYMNLETGHAIAKAAIAAAARMAEPFKD